MNINKKLEAELRSKRWDAFWGTIILAILFTVYLKSEFAYLSGDTSEIKGTVKHLFTADTQDSESFFIYVDIGGDTIKKIEIPRETKITIGDTVVLLVRKTNLLDLRNYKFLKVVKNNQSQ